MALNRKNYMPQNKPTIWYLAKPNKVKLHINGKIALNFINKARICSLTNVQFILSALGFTYYIY